MGSLFRRSRLLVVAAAASFAAILAAYGFAPHAARARAVVADIAWTWAALYAVVCCVAAWRRTSAPHDRRAWLWVGAGCASFLAGQLVWNSYDLLRGSPPSYPSLADAGFLGTYVCFLIAVAVLVRSQPVRRPDPELVLDTLLVTLTAGGLTYELLLAPLAERAGDALALLTSIAWSVGGIAVLWMILVQMLRRTAFPLAAAGLLLAGVATTCVTNIVYAGVALRGAFAPGGVLDLGWDAGFLTIAAAAAVAPDRTARADAPSTASGVAARTAALLVGLIGMTALAVRGLQASVPATDVSILIGVGMAIIAARLLYSVRADRRYTELLEREVADQTRSLMSALAATAAAERSLRLVMESVPDAVLLLDRDGRVLDANSAGRALASRDVVIDNVPGRVAGFVRDHLAATFAGALRRFEVPFLHADGTEGVSSVLCAPVREGERITKVLALARDITEQRRTQAQLQQAEKLAAMGQMVSGVAHEINNPVATISGFAQTLLLDDLGREQREMVQMIYDEATRIGRITSNLLAFARAGGRERTLVDVNDIARRTFALRSYHLSTLNIAVTLDLDPGEPHVWINGSELQQLLLNLLINAEQALTTVDTRRAITLRTRTQDDEVRLEVQDTGPGVPREIQGKIFDPFFTTKPEGTGTGLGLSICYGIAHDHGGRIWLEPESTPGATFCVALPRDPRTHERPAVLVQPGRAPGAERITVLLVDDEASLRQAVVRFLRRRGMDATAVGDGVEALAALKTRRFDVVVSDVRMPGMNGGQFLEHLRREHAGLVGRLVFVTGDTFAPDTVALLRESGVPSLVKPYDFAELEARIRDIVRAAGPAV